jgi:TRAP-type C4-dicarboxylate transport system substrate-binding protein
MKKLFLVILSVFVSLLIMGGYSQAAPEKPIKLIFTHFEPPAGVGGSSAIEFCKELEEKTGGRVKAETALAGSLGPVPEQFELVATGAADIGGFIPAYTPGRFPLFSLMVELPHKVDKTVPLTKAYNELVRKGYFDKEFEPTKLLWVSSVPPLQLFWANERIATLEGLKGKKVRTSGEFWLAVAPKLGMVPVSMTIADIYSALEKGTVDGTFLPFSTMDVYKMREVTKYAMELNLTYNCFACAMNKAVYEKLPKDIRMIIDELAQKYGDIEAWKHDEWDRKGKKNFLAMTGREAYPIQETEWKKILGVLKPISEEWVSKREAKGYPARRLMEDLRSTLKKYGVTEAIID